MDTSLIYSITGKGLMALKTGASELTPAQANVLRLIDGTSNVLVLAALLKDLEAAKRLPATLEQLAEQELIHVFDEAEQAVASTPLPEIEVVELSPTESVQAWAEAQRGARELAEKGYFSPASGLRHAKHESGADVNRVLVVEDDATTAEVLKFLLSENGFQAVITRDGEAALAELEKKPLPDVVLLDVMLPGRDGFEILRHIRHSAHLQALPVIMVTSQIKDEHVLRGLTEGADGYVFKPFKWETLHACIQNVL